MYGIVVNSGEVSNVVIKQVEDLDLSSCSDIYIGKSIEYLKKELVLNSTIKKLYPNEFSLPDIQKLYEDLLGKKYDRRNFRKKLIKLNIIFYFLLLWL